MKAPIKIDSEDGVKYINVYSAGKTFLGKALSNFNLSPGILPEGHFRSVEGYWYYLSLPDIKDKEVLKELTGWKAKSSGEALIKEFGKTFLKDFKEKIYKALELSIYNNSNLCKLIRLNNLPLKHYYVYGDKKVQVRGLDWYLDFLTQIINNIKTGNSCNFDVDWYGPCSSYAKETLCSKHQKEVCHVCHKQAVRDSLISDYYCMPLCASCSTPSTIDESVFSLAMKDLNNSERYAFNNKLNKIVNNES